MPEKLIIMIFICACVAGVLTSSAHHPRPIHGGAKEREDHENGVKGRQDGVDETDDWENERDEDRFDGLPESVLSVQYDRGLIKELHLSQGIGGIRDSREWSPSLSEKSRICDDLCRAGLGGDPCGYSCLDRTPSTIKNITGNSDRNTQTTTKKPKEDEDQTVGNPRSDVCPTLCKNGLGKPLCGCTKSRISVAHWQSVCDSFCTSTVGSYCVNGCPPCDAKLVVAEGESKQNSDDKWVEYCKQQCRTGNGGAACNCDKIPFVLRP